MVIFLCVLNDALQFLKFCIYKSLKKPILELKSLICEEKTTVTVLRVMVNHLQE